MSNQHKNIHEAMVAIKSELGPLAKDQFNQIQKFKFRGIDDVYEHVQKVMAKHGVYSMPTVLEHQTEERTTQRGSALIYRVLMIKHTFYHTSGTSVESVVVGEGMDSGDKASNKAMSVGDKYSLLQAYKIPTREAKDPDGERPEMADGSEGLEPKRTKSVQEQVRDAKAKQGVQVKQDAIYTGSEQEVERLIGLIDREGFDDPLAVMDEIDKRFLNKPKNQIIAFINSLKKQKRA